LSWAEETLSVDDLELIFVQSIGGRMMDVRYQGTSLLFQNPDLLPYQPDLKNLQLLPTRTPHFPFPLWGGEKTWIAPDSDWPDGAPHSVLDSGGYSYQKQDKHRALMTSSVCPESSLQINRQVTLIDTNRWSIEHRVTNQGLTPRTVGLWSVLMTQNPVTYYCRTSIGQAPKTVFGNPGNAFRTIDGVGCITCDARQKFKLGIHPVAGVSAARISTSIGDVWIVNHSPVLSDPNAYAHGQALEFFNSGHYDYAELEWHSPTALLQPNDCLTYELDYHVYHGVNGMSDVEMFQLFDSRAVSKP